MTTTHERQVVSSVCRKNTIEYVRVMNWLGLEGQLKAFSLAQVKLVGTAEILEWCHRIEKILGFQPGSVRYVFCKGLRGGGKGNYWTQEVFLGGTSSVHVIVHELVHLLSFKDVTVFGQYDGQRRNNSYHNEGFASWLLMAMDNVLEHSEELGIRVWTVGDVLAEYSFV